MPAHAAAAPPLGRQGLGQASAPTASIETPNTASTTKTPRHEVQRSITPPSVGARIGAAPMTSISRENSLAAASPVNRSRTTAMRDHRGGRGAEALQHPQRAEHREVRRDDAEQRRQDVHADAGQQRAAPADRVGERADQQLAEREADAACRSA